MHYVTVAVNVFAALLALGVIGVNVYNWQVDRQMPWWEETPWHGKCFRVARDSATMLLGYAQLVVSALLQNLDSLANALHMPEITQVLDKYFDPKIAGYVLLVSGMLIIWARSRTLVK